MIAPREIGDSMGMLPIPMELFEIIHNISMFLLVDDKHDLGRGVYYERDDHYYHGRFSAHHPSMWHHWQIGLFGLMISQLGTFVTKGMELFGDYKRIGENGDLSGLDDNILKIIEGDNTITLDEYKQELGDLTISSQEEGEDGPPKIILASGTVDFDTNQQANHKSMNQSHYQHSDLKVPEPPSGLIGLTL